MLYELILEEESEGVRAISLVDDPAIEENWIALKAEEYSFRSIDEEKRLIMGAVLVPDKPIYRNQGGEEFYIYFTKETIRAALEKYAKSGNHKQATLEHELAIQGVTTIESWIVEDSVHDKSALYGLKLPIGSWVATMKVDSPEVWSLVKEGRVKGFSIEGLFKRKESDKETTDLSKEVTELASYTDYPEGVKNNAKRGIELNEKNGNKCATQTGKVRAQQLANGEPISEETIKRMYSYLSRAEGDYDESDTSACGTISYLLWGGKAAKRWSEAKLKELGAIELSTPQPGESKEDFLSRCMGELVNEFPDEKQRYAVCNQYAELTALEDLERLLSNNKNDNR